MRMHLEDSIGGIYTFLQRAITAFLILQRRIVFAEGFGKHHDGPAFRLKLWVQDPKRFPMHEVYTESSNIFSNTEYDG